MYINISLKTLEKNTEERKKYLDYILENTIVDDELYMVITNIDDIDNPNLDQPMDKTNHFALKISTKDELNKLIAELKFLYT